MAGIGQGFLDVSSFAVLTDQFSADLVTVIALCEAAIALGCLVGPPSGAALYEAAGFRVPFLVIGICSGLLLYVFAVCDFGILWSPLPEDLEEGDSKHEGKEEEFQISDLCHVKIIIPSLTVVVPLSSLLACCLLSLISNPTRHILITQRSHVLRHAGLCGRWPEWFHRACLISTFSADPPNLHHGCRNALYDQCSCLHIPNAVHRPDHTVHGACTVHATRVHHPVRRLWGMLRARTDLQHCGRFSSDVDCASGISAWAWAWDGFRSLASNANHEQSPGREGTKGI